VFQFKKRSCPICRKDSQHTLTQMKVGILLESNPGYHKNWFTENTISVHKELEFKYCSTCVIAYVSEVLEDYYLQKYYEEAIDHAKSFSKIFSKKKRKQVYEILSQLHKFFPDKEKIKIVDFGAGWGDFLMAANTYGVECYALELDSKKVQKLLNHRIKAGNHDFLHSEGPFDAFICNQMLEHLDQPNGMLSSITELLYDGAVGFISVPIYSKRILQQEVKLIESGKLPSKDFDPLGHLNYFSAKSFRNMISRHGFSEIQTAGRIDKTKEILGFKQKDNNLFVRFAK